MHLGGAKALFCYINLQVTDSVGRAKPCKIFYLGGGNAFRTPCRYVPGPQVVAISFVRKNNHLRAYTILGVWSLDLHQEWPTSEELRAAFFIVIPRRATLNLLGYMSNTPHTFLSHAYILSNSSKVKNLRNTLFNMSARA